MLYGEQSDDKKRFSLLNEDGRPVNSQIQTGYNFKDLYTHTFGCYECRCRLQQDPRGWWSAFWLQSPTIGASLDPATKDFVCCSRSHKEYSI